MQTRLKIDKSKEKFDSLPTVSVLSFYKSSKASEIDTLLDDNYKLLENGNYFCKKCNKEVPFKSKYRHNLIHRRTEYCKKCKSSYTPEGFKQHKCLLENYCKECDKKFTRKVMYQRHLRKHGIEVDIIKPEQQRKQKETFFCSICEKSFKMKCYKNHMMIHNESKACEICGKIFRKHLLLRHLKLHEKYKCLKCGKYCKNTEKLNIHLSTHSDYNCPLCTKVLNTERLLFEHYSLQHFKVKPPFYKCMYCEKTIKCHLAHLRVHKNDPIQCIHCDQILKNKQALIAHKRSHIRFYGSNMPAKIKSPVYHCSECNIGPFNRRSNLLRHYKTCHITLDDCKILCDEVLEIARNKNLVPAINYVECEECEIEFPTVRSLRKHEIAVHGRSIIQMTKLEKYISNYRSKPLKSKMSSVACIHCNTVIKKPSIKTWRVHRQNCYVKGIQLKSKQCHLCHYITTDNKSMKIHLEEHKRAMLTYKEHTCPFCSKSFLSHLRLKAHFIQVHSINLVKSRACKNC